MRLEDATTATGATGDVAGRRRRLRGRLPAWRDYRLTAAASAAAAAKGLAEAQWYLPPVDPERLRTLTERGNWRAARDSVIWLALLAGTATAAFLALGTWYAVPAFAAFGALYGGSADARWHENGHGTAFRARWANDAMYYLASFMLLREATLWRWSHFRHHSDTIVVGRDAEISFPRPARLRTLLPNYLNLVNGPKLLWRTLLHAAGKMEETTRQLVPEADLRRVAWEARAYVAVLAGAIAWAASAGAIVPLLFVGLPSFYGAWLVVFFGLTQHAGLREDVLDHRLNTRTVYMNPFFRFLYLNMNYHLEHHLFPAVPYYNLPQLHAEIKVHLPPPQPSIFAAYREIFHALRMQRRDPGWELPDRRPAGDGGARPTAGLAVVEAMSGLADLGPAGALGVGEIRRVDRGGGTYVLCRLEGGSLVLADGLCTHAATHLADGHLDGCELECPKHLGRFDLRTGAAVRRPARAALRTYRVEIVGGRIRAALPDGGGAEGETPPVALKDPGRSEGARGPGR